MVGGIIHAPPAAGCAKAAPFEGLSSYLMIRSVIGAGFFEK